MKFFDKEFIEALTQPRSDQSTEPRRESQLPLNAEYGTRKLNHAEMDEIPLILANTSQTAAERQSASSGNCTNKDTCLCGSGVSVDETLFDPSGIQAMVSDMLTQSGTAEEYTAAGAGDGAEDSADAGLTPEMLRQINESVEWDRLENIVRLSELGDGWANWDSDAASRSFKDGLDQLLNRTVTRRTATMMIATGLLAGLGLLQTSCTSMVSPEKREEATIRWKEYFKGNFRLMTDDEKAATVKRLERMHELKTGKTLNVSTADAQPNVLYGYAFNISKCRGYMDCVRGCLQENNQDRASDMRYIRIHEHKQGHMNFDEAVDDFFHEVPAADHFYIGTQCFHCENPPCVHVCPVQATWKEPDGIVVVDYDWCIGCRYCLAACPYDARRFNWADPVIPEEEINRNQHYLGNRLRKQGVTEKCTFCIQRTRVGKNPACVESCPTGARIFGNLLDPDSEIRWVLKNKKVFRLKEDLGTEPKFWYFMD